MKQNRIVEVRIDDEGRLLVRTAETSFEQIYRAALGVHWDESAQALVSPVPDRWSHADWFTQILSAAADEYGMELILDTATAWVGVPPDARHEMESFAHSDWLGAPAALRAAHGQASWDGHRLQQALAQAAPLWESGRYAAYVEALSSVRDLLSRAQLKKLDIAEKRSRG
jgi:hypothetical protein